MNCVFCNKPVAECLCQKDVGPRTPEEEAIFQKARSMAFEGRGPYGTATMLGKPIEFVQSLGKDDGPVYLPIRLVGDVMTPEVRAQRLMLWLRDHVAAEIAAAVEEAVAAERALHAERCCACGATIAVAIKSSQPPPSSAEGAAGQSR